MKYRLIYIIGFIILLFPIFVPLYSPDRLMEIEKDIVDDHNEKISSLEKKREQAEKLECAIEDEIRMYESFKDTMDLDFENTKLVDDTIRDLEDLIHDIYLFLNITTENINSNTISKYRGLEDKLNKNQMYRYGLITIGLLLMIYAAQKDKIFERPGKLKKEKNI